MEALMTLGIGRMEIDWARNHSFSDHSALFQHADFKQIPYYYSNDDADELIIEMKEGLSRKLSALKKRLDLLGYSIYKIESLYNETVIEHEKYGGKIHLTFDEYSSIIKQIKISQVDTIKIALKFGEFDFGEYVRECILEEPHIKQCNWIEYNDTNFYTHGTRRELSEFLENLDPYITLRILAENHCNDNLELQWNFADSVADGVLERSDITKGLAPEQQILIVTEGSSDSFILKKALCALYPDIADFFVFVDMQKNYPFTGTGNLYNFCLGLARINIMNSVIAIFDNDTAGIEKYEQSLVINKPHKFLITKLPDHPEFSSFHTVGPQGETIEDINGKAVAIECFLDLKSRDIIPSIRWTSFNEKINKYQGALVEKDSYVHKYKKCNLTDGSYNTAKLKYLIDNLLDQWIMKTI